VQCKECKALPSKGSLPLSHPAPLINLELCFHPAVGLYNTAPPQPNHCQHILLLNLGTEQLH
jgi:hypothetical protein